jgi:hypothetical protein
MRVTKPFHPQQPSRLCTRVALQQRRGYLCQSNPRTSIWDKQSTMAEIKLIALDGDDLAILSAHCQDAVVRVKDLAYVARDRRFALVCNRFDWLGAGAKPPTKRANYERHRAGLRFERVTKVRTVGIDLKAMDAVLVLLAIQFEADQDAPAGDITLQFANGAAIRLSVDYIEAELKDLGAVWSTSNKPNHSES